MVKYTCEKCGKEFKQKCHYMNHLQRKTPCNDIKDKTLAKYFLENFKRKINELTPNLIYNKNKFLKFKKRYNPLKETKELYKKRNKFGEKELKEFSILFLVINNLDIFRKHIELISTVNFSDNK